MCLTFWVGLFDILVIQVKIMKFFVDEHDFH